MKTARSAFALGLGILLLYSWQTTAAAQSAQPAPTDDLQTIIQLITSTTPVPAGEAPKSGTFYSAQFGLTRPPLPGDVMNLPFWDLGGGFYLLDDTNVDYASFQAQPEAEAAPASPNGRFSMLMASSLLNSSYAYGNPVYLTNIAATPSSSATVASFSIAGGTNFVPYDILMTTNITNLVSSWSWLGIGYTSNRYTFSNQPSNLAFYILAKPRKTMVVGWGNDAAGQCDVPYGLSNAVMVAGGGGQSLALRNDGTVAAWGQNAHGEGSVPTNLTGVTMITAGWYHDLALLTNGTVTAWGFDGASLGYHLTEVPANLTNVTLISAQALHSLALSSNGTVTAWGYNTLSGETNVPAGLTNVTAISAGYQFNLAVSNGMVVAWGDNSLGQCNVPAGLSNVVDVEAGVYHSLALLKNGTVVAWGDGSDGETNVPVALTNVVAIAAGGDPLDDTAYSLALKSDGTVVAWGEGLPVAPVQGLSNVFAIGAGSDHALAIRTGPRTPVITLEPTDQYQLPGGNVTFTARGTGLYGVTYQWQTNGVNLAGATNATLTLTNVQSGQLGSYDVVVTDNGGMGNITSSIANLYFVTPPVINLETLPTNQFVIYQATATLNVGATAPGQFNGFPLSYQWAYNGANISGATASNYTFTAVNSGTYSVTVTNAAGSTNVAWQVTIVYPGGIFPWGSNAHGEENPPQLTNVLSLAAGTAHGLVALDTGSATNWGSYWTGTNYVAVSAPPSLTNAIAVAAGFRHDLALKADGRVIAWGLNDFGQTNVPAGATNVIAIAAGGNQGLALKKDGTVLQWGQTNAPVPTGLTNVTAIACGTNFNLALLQNSTVVAWGTNDYGQTNVPAGLSNVVAIAAGGAHALALKPNGTVTAWGALTNVPANLTNAMGVAAGENHDVALRNDGTVTAWGDNTFGQTNTPGGLNGVKLIAGGGDFTVAALFSTFVSYPVDVTRDLLLIYNTNSAGSAMVENYYLQNRPMVSGANALGIGCPTNEIIDSATFTSQVLAPYLNWLTNNPTKHPQYVVLFLDVPSRVDDTTTHPSVQYQLSTGTPGIQPFVTSINMNGTNDCIGYINKLAYFGTNYSPGKLIISASAGGYGNTNYYFEDVNGIYPAYPFAFQATQGVTSNGVPSSAVDYLSFTNTTHITRGTNVSGYLTWGANGGLGGDYPTNGAVVFTGNSAWYLIETIESYNGQRNNSGQGTFIKWLAPNAFGGTNYSKTPIGAVSHVEEPSVFNCEASQVYFGLWVAEKHFAMCAWNSRQTPYFQAVGDPFVVK